MENYKEMYFTLFNAVAQAIDQLQNAQLKTEDLYISGEETAALEEATQEQVMTTPKRGGMKSPIRA